MVHYIERGNIFKIPDVKNFAHGCNCTGAMGRGIALQFKYMFPEMYGEYKKRCRNGHFKPKDVFIYPHRDGYIFNLGTQATWYTKATYENIEQSLKTMMHKAEKMGITSIAMPAIGAGLGGLNWNNIKAIIDKVALQYSNINLYVVEQYDGLMKETFIKKEWKENHVIFYIHFIDDDAVRQIEIDNNNIICISFDNLEFLCDAYLSDIEFSKEDLITKEEFDKIWKKYYKPLRF